MINAHRILALLLLVQTGSVVLATITPEVASITKSTTQSQESSPTITDLVVHNFFDARTKFLSHVGRRKLDSFDALIDNDREAFANLEGVHFHASQEVGLTIIKVNIWGHQSELENDESFLDHEKQTFRYKLLAAYRAQNPTKPTGDHPSSAWRKLDNATKAQAIRGKSGSITLNSKTFLPREKVAKMYAAHLKARELIQKQLEKLDVEPTAPAMA